MRFVYSNGRTSQAAAQRAERREHKVSIAMREVFCVLDCGGPPSFLHAARSKRDSARSVFEFIICDRVTVVHHKNGLLHVHGIRGMIRFCERRSVLQDVAVHILVVKIAVNIYVNPLLTRTTVFV